MALYCHVCGTKVHESGNTVIIVDQEWTHFKKSFLCDFALSILLGFSWINLHRIRY